MTKPNYDLIEKVLVRIEDTPDNWDQGVWVNPEADNECGTTMCTAGHTLIESGLYHLDHWQFVSRQTGKPVTTDQIEVVARRLLGLTPTAAGSVFYSMTTDVDVLRSQLYAAARRSESGSD